MTVLENATAIWAESWDPDLEVFKSDNVTKEVQSLARVNKMLTDQNEKLKKELTDIRTRRSWDEVQSHQDQNTGRMIVLRTTYQWQIQAVRLEVDPALLYSASGLSGATALPLKGPRENG